MNGFGPEIQRFASEGRFINMVSPGSQSDEIIGVLNFGTIFRMNINQPTDIEFLDLDEINIIGLPEHVTMYKFLLIFILVMAFSQDSSPRGSMTLGYCFNYSLNDWFSQLVLPKKMAKK